MKVALKNLVEIKSGYSPSAFELMENGSIPYVKVEDMNNCTKYQNASREYCEDVDRSVPAGAIIFPKRGAAIMNNKVRITATDICMDTNMMAIIPNGKIQSEFLYYTIIYEKLSRIADTSTIPQINNKHINPYKVALPPLPEQKAIAALLSTWDEAIEKTERLIQAKERRLDAYARDLFDRKNDGKHEGWKVVKLKTVLTEHGNKSTGSEEVYSVSVHKGLVNQIEHLGRSFSAANTDNYNRVHYGDIVYTKSPTGDFPLGIVKQSYAKQDVIVSPLYGVFTPRNFNLGIVLDFYFSSPARARNYLFPIVQKGAKNTIAITNKTFLSKALHLPVDEKAQKAVAEFVYAAREEIDLLKQLADKYKTQKSGLMQKMLTGEWRVKPEIVNQYMEA